MATDEHGFARMNRRVGDWAHAKPRSREAAKPRRGKSLGQATDAVGPRINRWMLLLRFLLSVFSCLHSVAGMP
jgi:hypothetical protein